MIGDKLKDARLERGLKQSEVAEKLNCAPTSLTNWERNKVKPSMEVLSNLCEAYGIKPLSLLDRVYRFNDLMAASKKNVSDRTYEEQIILNFPDEILEHEKDKYPDSVPSQTMIERIGRPAMLEQLAEESAELAKAALKTARVLRGENPTPVSLEKAKQMLREEYTDVVQCARELQLEPDEPQIQRKEQRFTERWIRQSKGGKNE